MAIWPSEIINDILVIGGEDWNVPFFGKLGLTLPPHELGPQEEGGGGEPLASAASFFQTKGESQSLKCVRELLYPHADGTLLLLAQACSGSILRYRAATLTQNQF